MLDAKMWPLEKKIDQYHWKCIQGFALLVKLSKADEGVVTSWYCWFRDLSCTKKNSVMSACILADSREGSPELSCHTRTLDRSPRLRMSAKRKVSVCLRSNLLALLHSFSASFPVSPYSPNMMRNTLASVPAPTRRNTINGEIRLNRQQYSFPCRFYWPQEASLRFSFSHSAHCVLFRVLWQILFYILCEV